MKLSQQLNSISVVITMAVKKMYKLRYMLSEDFFLPQKQRNRQASVPKITLHIEGASDQGPLCLHLVPILVHASQLQVADQEDHQLVCMVGY
jgi:hypothetical protein